MRDPRQRSLTLAISLLLVAAVLVISAGLPQRSDYTQIGQIGNIPVAPEVGAIGGVVRPARHEPPQGAMGSAIRSAIPSFSRTIEFA